MCLILIGSCCTPLGTSTAAGNGFTAGLLLLSQCSSPCRAAGLLILLLPCLLLPLVYL